VLFSNEIHGLARPANVAAFFAIVESFFARHLGGVNEPIGEALQLSSLSVPLGAEQIPGVVDALPQPEKKPLPSAK
jgi:hypothetical protein